MNSSKLTKKRVFNDLKDTKKINNQQAGWFGKKKSIAQKEAKKKKKMELEEKKRSKRKPQYVDCHVQSERYAGVSIKQCNTMIKKLSIAVDKETGKISPKHRSKLYLTKTLKAFFEGEGIWDPEDVEKYLKVGDKVKYQYEYKDEDGFWAERTETGYILHQQSKDGLSDLGKKFFKRKSYIWKKDTGIATGTNIMPAHNERYYSVWNPKLGTSHFLAASDIGADYTTIEKLFNQTSMEDTVTAKMASNKTENVRSCELGGWACPTKTRGLRCIDDDGTKVCDKSIKRPGPDCHAAKWTRVISAEVEPIDHAMKIWNNGDDDGFGLIRTGNDIKKHLLSKIKVASAAQVIAFFKQIIKKKGSMDKRWTVEEFKEFATNLTNAVWDSGNKTMIFDKKDKRTKKKDPKERFRIWPLEVKGKKIKLAGTKAQCSAVKPPEGTTIKDLIVLADNEDPKHIEVSKLCEKAGCLYDKDRLTDFVEGDGVSGHLCLPIPNVPLPAKRSDLYWPAAICHARDMYTKTHPFYFKCKEGDERQLVHSQSRFDPSENKWDQDRASGPDYCVKQKVDKKIKTHGTSGSPIKYFEKECMDNAPTSWEWINSDKTCPNPFPHSMISRTPVGGPGTGKVGECGWIAIEANSNIINIHPYHRELFDQKPVLFVRPDSALGKEIMGSKLSKKIQSALKYLEDNSLGDRIAYATKNIFKKYVPSYPVDIQKCMKSKVALPTPVDKLAPEDLYEDLESNDDWGNA